VEDDDVNIILMTAVLGMRPQVRLKVAVSGAEAIRAVHEQVPDLLLIDMHLPDTNGIELLVALRGVDGLQAVPAVMVSAGARQQDIDRALASGFAGYWTKPLDIDKTLAAMDELLGPGGHTGG
jgi:CheY-like chemotaxis protein